VEIAIIIILVIALVAVIGFAAWQYMERRRTDKLRSEFGPEYYRAREREGSRKDAEAELSRRRKRRERLDIRPLKAEEQERFAERWERIQRNFVDDPGGSVAEADGLLNEVMRTRGYPVDDFEERADDLSVEYPEFVEDYRRANRIASASRRGEAETEDLRQSLTYYRNLFQQLLHSGQRTEVRR
jgi:hypothetical protein